MTILCSRNPKGLPAHQILQAYYQASVLLLGHMPTQPGACQVGNLEHVEVRTFEITIVFSTQLLQCKRLLDAAFTTITESLIKQFSHNHNSWKNSVSFMQNCEVGGKK